MQYASRGTSDHQRPLKRFLQGDHGRTAFDIPAIDKEMLHTRFGRQAAGRVTYPQTRTWLFVFHRKQTSRKIPPVNGINGLFQITATRRVKRFSAFRRKRNEISGWESAILSRTSATALASTKSFLKISFARAYCKTDPGPGLSSQPGSPRPRTPILLPRQTT